MSSTGYEEFLKYKNFEEINFEQLKLAVNFICFNLNAIGCNYPYWYDFYCCTSKTFFVLRWKKERKLGETVKLGEVICCDKIINFIENEHKCHCSSLYYNAIDF